MSGRLNDNIFPLVGALFFVALFVLSLCPFDISVGVGAFVIGLGQISSFLALRNLVSRVLNVYILSDILIDFKARLCYSYHDIRSTTYYKFKKAY